MKVENNSSKKIPKNVWAMGWTSFFNDIASEMIYPIVPLFLKNVLGAPVYVIGLIEGVAESTASLLKLISGRLSDKFKRRKSFVAFGYFLSAISKIFMALAQSWPFVLLARFIDRFGKGTRTSARDALILESINPGQRGRAFGLHRAMDSAGAVVGPLLALLMISIFADSYRTIFAWAFLPAILGVFILMIFVKEKKREIRPEPSAKSIDVKFKWKELNPDLRFFLLVSAVFALGNSSDVFLILRSQNIGLGVTLTVAAYVVYNIFYTFFSYPAGVLSDKIGPKKILVTGFFLYALVYFGFGLDNKTWLIWILFSFYGIYIALTDGVGKAYVASMTKVEKSGTAFGVYQMIIGFGALLASLLAGLIWDYINPGTAFVFGAICALAGGVLLSMRKNNASVKVVA